MPIIRGGKKSLIACKNMQRSRPRGHFIYLYGAMELFEKIGTVEVVPKNHTIIKLGEVPDCCFVVKRGSVVSCEVTANGEERIYHVLEQGALLLEANLLTDTPQRIRLKMLTNGELIRIDKNAFLHAMQENPAIQMVVIESISNKFFSAMRMVREKSNLDASKKICRLLFDLADYKGVESETGILICSKISQQMISNLLGINRITTVRTLTSLKEKGLIDSIDGHFRINNTERMRNFLK